MEEYMRKKYGRILLVYCIFYVGFNPEMVLAQGGPAILISFPTLQSEPKSSVFSVVLGKSLKLEMKALSATALSVQWLKNGKEIENSKRVSGARGGASSSDYPTNTNTLIISDVTPQDAGIYQVLLDNSSGTITSPKVRVFINSTGTPANNNFSNRITLPSRRNVYTFGNNVNADLEPGESQMQTESGGSSVWWSWTAPTSNLVNISTAGSDFDTILGVYTGTSLSNLVLIAKNDDIDSTNLTSKLTFNAVAGTIYHIKVEDWANRGGNITLGIESSLIMPNTKRAVRVASQLEKLSHISEGQELPIKLSIKVGENELLTELAKTPEQIQKGLAGRNSMSDSEGMLFVYNYPHREGYRMSNTTIPISLAYIDSEGTILEIKDMEPLDDKLQISTSDHVQYVLEVNRGWFAQHGVNTGSKIITERGSLAQTFRKYKSNLSGSSK